MGDDTRLHSDQSNGSVCLQRIMESAKEAGEGEGCTQQSNGSWCLLLVYGRGGKTTGECGYNENACTQKSNGS